MPNILNLQFYSGDDDELKFVIKNAGVVVDITGATAVFQVRTSTDAAAPILNINGIIVGALGEITFPVTKADTALLTPSNIGPKHYIHDVELTYANGNVETLFKGAVTGFADVSRAV
jgi:hypothetical protein